MPRTDRRWAPLGLAVLFTGSGILHLLRPGLFLPLIPRALPAPDVLVAASGFAELGCAAGLVGRRSWSGPASAALLIAVFPGNVQFALDRSTDPEADPRVVVLAWLRLPLQAALIWAALQDRGRDAP